MSASQAAGLSRNTLRPERQRLDPGRLPVAAALLRGAIVSCAFAVNATRSWFQAAGIVWALVAIALANVLRAPEPMLVLLACGGVGLVLLARAAPRISGSRSLRTPA